MVQKPTLQWYREAKLYIGYDTCYGNYINSDFIAKARTNCLQLEEYFGRRNRNYDTTCKLCSQGEENLEHFLVECHRLEEKRTPLIMEGPPMSAEEKTIQILFKNKNHQEIALMLKNMWNLRKRMRNNLRPP